MIPRKRPLNWTRPLLAGLAATVLACAATADDSLPPEMAELARLYREHVGELTTRYQETVKALPRQYETDLATLLDRYQKGGNLDGVLAVAREQKRFADAMQAERDPFELTPEMPPAAVVAHPPELRARQELYLRQHSEASDTRRRGVADLTTKYLARLETVQRDLTRAGRIRDAVTVKRESDRLSKGVADDTLVQLVQTMLAESHGGAVADDTPAASTNATDEVPTFGSVPNWARWRAERPRPFARERVLFDHPDLPDELSATYSARTGRGRFWGRCEVDRRQVGPYLCAWFGKALLWRVEDPATLSATIDLESLPTALSAGQDGGPHAQLAVFAGATPLKVLNVPLMSTKATLGVFRDPASSRCALRWVQGKQTEFFELPEGAELRLLLAVTVRNPGEECDTSFSLRP